LPLLSSPNLASQESAARCCGLLASEHLPIQLALWHQKADEQLAVLLGSDSRVTQGWAQKALLHLAICSESRAAIVARLVSCLGGRSTSAQFKAADADGNGEVSREEMKVFLQKLNPRRAAGSKPSSEAP
jgi:hypothetical protein